MDYIQFLMPKKRTKKELLKEFVYKMKLMGMAREATDLVELSTWGKLTQS